MFFGPDAVFFRLLTICLLLFQFGHDNPIPTECTEPAKLNVFNLEPRLVVMVLDEGFITIL